MEFASTSMGERYYTEHIPDAVNALQRLAVIGELEYWYKAREKNRRDPSIPLAHMNKIVERIAALEKKLLC